MSDVFFSVFVSSSTGKINSVSLNEAGQLVGLRSWKAHEHEAWIVAADRWNTNIVYSGMCLIKNHTILYHRYYILRTRDCVPLGFKETICVVLINTFPL